MATLRHQRSNTLHPVPARLLVGRAKSCLLSLDDPHVSGEHATLAWSGEHWVLRDLGSRNGTFVDGKRLESGGSQPITVGQVIAFGNLEDGYEVVDAGPAAAVAQGPDGRLCVAVEGQLALPSPAAPAVVIYCDDRGRWVCEQEGEVSRIDDGHSVVIDGASWIVRVPAMLDGTATMDVGPTLDTVRLRFGVSLDEEHVELTILSRGREIEVEAREHSYILLTLARARLADAALPLKEQGWIDRDRLLKMLQLDTNALNVGIYRARGQLAKAGLEGATGIVQVRRGHRRFGMEPDRFEITSLG